ncbi:hypothetical protein D3C78_1376350 [compost metagenome]
MLWIKLIHKLKIPINRIGCSPVPAASILTFMRWQHEYPTVLTVQIPIAAYSDVRMQYEWLILSQHTNCINT